MDVLVKLGQELRGVVDTRVAVADKPLWARHRDTHVVSLMLHSRGLVDRHRPSQIEASDMQ